MPKPPLPDELLEVLAKPNPSVISTLRKDGSPVTTATWYVWDDGQLLVNMDESRKRLAHMRRDPRVSITVLDDDWYRHISLLGRVVRLEDDEGLEQIDRIAAPLPRHRVPRARPQARQRLDRGRAVARLGPLRAPGTPVR